MIALSAARWAGVAAVGGVLIAIGAFLPWISITAGFVGTVTRSGVDGGGDGLLFVGGGALVALLGLSGATTDPLRVRSWLIVLACVGFVGAAFEFISMSGRISGLADTVRPLASIGAGVFLCGFGAVLAFVAAWQINDWDMPE